MNSTQTLLRPGAYYDSIVLMQLQRALTKLPGVVDAGVVMGTPANKTLLAESGLLPPEAQTALPDDLLIVIKGETDRAVQDALAQVASLLKRQNTDSHAEFRPKSLDSALKMLPDARWALISVPGRYAAGVARQALERNLHVFLYSDNVPLEDEIALKRTAREKGLLVMGSDCGTAIIHGVGFGFANHVRRGPIGLVGASGTGLQAVTSAIHNLGSGISHAIGTGGRDLKAEVGGLTALQALTFLADDPETNVIILVSKPPAPEVAARLLAAAQTCGKPVVVNFIGYPPPARKLGNVWFAVSLEEAAEIAIQVLDTGYLVLGNPQYPVSNKYLRGLFSGGTLAVEAVLALQNILYPLFTNVPISNHQYLTSPPPKNAHILIDLGEDEFTVGRLHPMIDNDLRIRRLRQEATDPEVGMILLDVVLGEGAHPNPSEELAPVIQEIRDSVLDFVVLLIGTEDDPQNLGSQMEQLENAGAKVFRRISDTMEYLLPRLLSLQSSTANLQFPLTPLAINFGLESFAESLNTQGAHAIHVDWRPPAGGNEKLAGILAKLKK
jgi:FdrA protein